jgi:hypothetical protein
MRLEFVESRSHDEILIEVATYFTAKLAQHGPTARGVDWN